MALSDQPRRSRWEIIAFRLQGQEFCVMTKTIRHPPRLYLAPL